MKYDLTLVRRAAENRWTEIFSAAAGISADILDGQHHPCPKCGGTDRFRLLDQAAGALFCNQCFRYKNGDGFAALMWLLNCNFYTALQKVADYLNIKPVRGAADPAQHLDFLP